MNQLRIAIITNKPDRLGDHYRDWLAQAGATSLELFYHKITSDWEERFSQCNALVLTGGGDFSLDSGAYNNPQEAKEAKIYGMNSERDNLESNLLHLALRQNKPVLGICRGCQAINVICGGTLIPDLSNRLGSQCDPAHTTTPEELNQPGTPDRFHPVMFTPQSSFDQIIDIKKPHLTNSYHHQAVDQLGEGLMIVAKAPDGVIEEIRLQKKPQVIGVQFHPERMREEKWIQKWTQNWVQSIPKN